ncbi:MAG: hypothetical protein QXH42_07250 [Thermoplasmata archaeon]
MKDIKKSKKMLQTGALVAVWWRDTTLRDHVRSKRFDSEKFMREMTVLAPTVTYGRVVGVRNDTLVICMEHCLDEDSPSSMVESIPLGAVTKIELLKPHGRIRKVRRRWALAPGATRAKA